MLSLREEIIPGGGLLVVQLTGKSVKAGNFETQCVFVVFCLVWTKPLDTTASCIRTPEMLSRQANGICFESKLDVLQNYKKKRSNSTSMIFCSFRFFILQRFLTTERVYLYRQSYENGRKVREEFEKEGSYAYSSKFLYRLYFE